MTVTLLLIAVAALAGIAVALQGQFMGVMDRRLGTATSMLITYGLGAIAAIAFWLARPRAVSAGARDVPWFAWSAGLLGLVIVGGIGYAAPRLGLSRTIVVTVAAQLVAAAIIDHFGLFGATQRAFDVGRAAGFALMSGGVWLIVRGS
jgi:transporter family-2 protein